MLSSNKPIVVVACLMPLATWALWEFYVYSRNSRRRSKIFEQMSTIFVVEKWSDWEELVAPKFISICEEHMVIGLDCEWTSNTGRVSLLQLATPTGLCVLIRLCKFQPPVFIPKSLMDLLANRKILKVGVNPNMDASKLFKDYNITVNGHLDIGWLAFEITRNKVNSYGLKGLAFQFLGVTLDKSFEVRCSNWDAPVLTQTQVEYAAIDAFVAVRIFYTLVNAKLSLWDKMHWFFTSTVPWASTDFSFRRYTNRPFSASKIHNLREGADEKHIQSGSRKQKPESKLLNTVRKSPLYHNNILQAPDGQPLCTCSTKKALWYIEQSLADLVSENPLVVRLRFEPGGRPTSQDDYYLQSKENVCVVCGRSDMMIRKNVIPQEYRRHFPTEMKDHKSHDVVLLCFSCHQISNLQDMVFKQHLAAEFNAPLGSGDNTRVRENSELKRIRSAARALSKTDIPESRRRELETALCEHFNVAELTPDILNEALNLDIRIENSEYIQHGFLVVKQMEQSEGLPALEQMWRQHFLTANSPQYLPKMWSQFTSQKNIC
ncbi:Exonuclease 3'-5' domain-containing protein 2 [Chamberlinius hualienensis]